LDTKVKGPVHGLEPAHLAEVLPGCGEKNSVSTGSGTTCSAAADTPDAVNRAACHAVGTHTSSALRRQPTASSARSPSDMEREMRRRGRPARPNLRIPHGSPCSMAIERAVCDRLRDRSATQHAR
jgi:hypothetical protein